MTPVGPTVIFHQAVNGRSAASLFRPVFKRLNSKLSIRLAGLVGAAVLHTRDAFSMSKMRHEVVYWLCWMNTLLHGISDE